MFAIISLLVTLTFSLIVTRVATVALMLTGLSRTSAKFQARSAFTGVGYTTSESESIVNHPVRRQVILLLMLLGNVGIVTVVATLILSLGQKDRGDINLLFLAAGLFALWMFASSRWVERQLNRIILFALKKFTRLDVRDYVALLELANGFTVSELKVHASDWLVGKRLSESRLSQEGILVLGIKHKDGTYVGAPDGSNMVEFHDTLVLYGTQEQIMELNERRSGRGGDFAHKSAVHEHGEYLEQLKAKVEQP